MSILIIFNREPYDNTDVTWNGLRLADQLSQYKEDVRIFLMNDSVDMARDVCVPPAGYQFCAKDPVLLVRGWTAREALLPLGFSI